MTTHNDESLKACQNTDVELYREGDFYSPSLHVTQNGSIGMNVGGHVITMPIREWHKLAKQPQPAPMQVDRLPPLPPDDMHGLNQRGLYTAEQMHEYALAALASRAEHAGPDRQ